MNNHRFRQHYLGICCKMYQNGAEIESNDWTQDRKVFDFLFFKMKNITESLYSVENNLVEEVNLLVCFWSNDLEEMREDGHSRQDELAFDGSVEFLPCLNSLAG